MSKMDTSMLVRILHQFEDILCWLITRVQWRPVDARCDSTAAVFKTRRGVAVTAVSLLSPPALHSHEGDTTARKMKDVLDSI